MLSTLLLAAELGDEKGEGCRFLAVDRPAAPVAAAPLLAFEGSLSDRADGCLGLAFCECELELSPLESGAASAIAPLPEKSPVATRQAPAATRK